MLVSPGHSRALLLAWKPLLYYSAVSTKSDTGTLKLERPFLSATVPAPRPRPFRVMVFLKQDVDICYVRNHNKFHVYLHMV
jgi:hypothetical protein